MEGSRGTYGKEKIEVDEADPDVVKICANIEGHGLYSDHSQYQEHAAKNYALCMAGSQVILPFAELDRQLHSLNSFAMPHYP